MLKRRLIPVLYLQNGEMVRSETFSIHQAIGHPTHHVQRLVEWDADEIFVIDITTAGSPYDFGRSDTRLAGYADTLQFIRGVSATCHIPLAFGGRVRSLDDIRIRIQNGADKVTVNSMLAEQPSAITDAAKAFGSQAIVASVDYRLTDRGTRVFTQCGRHDVGVDAVTWVKRAVDLGIGEILLTAIDRDGTARGYDIPTIQSVCDAAAVPIIACGGAGHHSHFAACLDNTGVSAVAAGNIFHFTENAYPRAKAFLHRNRDDVR